MRRTLLLLLIGCGTNETPQPAPVPTLPSCVPNRDGVIDADELPIALGATLAYYAGTNRSVDQTLADGAWDLAEERADDEVVAIGPVALRDQWYAGSFPSGQFVVDAGSGLDGIYHQDAQGLWLDGTASREENAAAGKTLIVYPQPLAVLRFPITVGDTFTQTVALDAVTINGLPFNGTDELEVNVADRAELDVPYVEFSPTLRVQTHVTRMPTTGGMTSRRQTLWMFECFGEVARAESNPDETDAEFTTAAYLRRFALGRTP
jgi:hypothetical protein